MIAKSVTGKSFYGLAKYLEGDPDRVEWKYAINLATDDPSFYVKEMEKTASLSKRVEQPVYHLSISYSLKDNPTPEQVIEDFKRLLKERGLERHQVVIVAHNDKDYIHAHAMVNRVGPDGQVFSTFRDRIENQKVLRQIEIERGYRYVPGIESGIQPDLTRLSQHEYHSIGSADAFSLRAAAAVEELKQATNWEEFNRILRSYNLALLRKGQGGVIVDADQKYEGTKRPPMKKLSKLDRDLSFNKLEKRFGPYNSYEIDKALSKIEASPEIKYTVIDLSKANGWRDFVDKVSANKFEWKLQNGSYYVYSPAESIKLDNLNSSFSTANMEKKWGENVYQSYRLQFENSPGDAIKAYSAEIRLAAISSKYALTPEKFAEYLELLKSHDISLQKLNERIIFKDLSSNKWISDKHLPSYLNAAKPDNQLGEMSRAYDTSNRKGAIDNWASKMGKLYGDTPTQANTIQYAMNSIGMKLIGLSAQLSRDAEKHKKDKTQDQIVQEMIGYTRTIASLAIHIPQMIRSVPTVAVPADIADSIASKMDSHLNPPNIGYERGMSF